MRLDVLEEFASMHGAFYAPLADLVGLPGGLDAWSIGNAHGHVEDRSDEVQAQRIRRRSRRAARAAARPPCPHCGARVERCQRTGKVPTYCTPKCMRAARWARWWAKNKDARNAQRRAA